MTEHLTLHIRKPFVTEKMPFTNGTSVEKQKYLARIKRKCAELLSFYLATNTEYFLIDVEQNWGNIDEILQKDAESNMDAVCK